MVLLNKSQFNLLYESRGKKCCAIREGASRNIGESRQIKLQTTAKRFQCLMTRLALFNLTTTLVRWWWGFCFPNPAQNVGSQRNILCMYYIIYDIFQQISLRTDKSRCCF